MLTAIAQLSSYVKKIIIGFWDVMLSDLVEECVIS
jgi:hypothetical protein